MIFFRRRNRDDSGAAAVEFALVVPLLLFLLFAIIGYGYMLSFRQAVSQAAAEGARSMAVAPSGQPQATTITEGESAVDQTLSGYGMDCTGGNIIRTNAGNADAGDCTVAIAACPNDAAKQCATITVTYNYRDNSLLPTFPGLGVVLPSSMSYTAVAEVS